MSEDKYTTLVSGIVVTIVAVLLAGSVAFGINKSVEVSKDRRANNQARCLKLIEQGQFLCSQDGSRQR